jgi:thermitase
MVRLIKQFTMKLKKSLGFRALGWNIFLLTAGVIGILPLISRGVFSKPHQPQFHIPSAYASSQVRGEVVVKTRPGSTGMGMESLIRVLGGRVKARIPRYGLLLIQFPKPIAGRAEFPGLVEDVIRRFRACADVEEVFPNMVIPGYPTERDPTSGKIIIPPDGDLKGTSLADYQWHLSQIKLFQAGTPPIQSPLIAVICTGVDYTHPDLKDRIIKGYDFVDDDTDPMDDDIGLGTELAGLAAASGKTGRGVLGISPTSKILAIRIVNRSGETTIFRMIQGLNYALDYPGASVILSTAGTWRSEVEPDYKVLKKIYDDAQAGGRLIVSPAGNDYNYWFFHYRSMNWLDWRPIPGWFASSFTIAATQELDYREAFSNYDLGTYKKKNYDLFFVDLVAPGDRLLSCSSGGTYNVGSGTGRAAAVAAGAAARVWGQNPGWTPQQVVARLQSTGKPLKAYEHGFYAQESRLDLMRAMGSKATGFSGVVYNGQAGIALPGVKVEALRGAKVAAGGVSGRSGFFTLTGLKGGLAYALRLSKEGFNSYITYGFKAEKDRIIEAPLPVFLNQKREQGQWSILMIWRSMDPGFTEAWQSRHSPFPDFPFSWEDSMGAYFIPYLKLNNNVLIDPVVQKRGSLSEPPYAFLTHLGQDNETPSHCILIKTVLDGVYYVFAELNNENYRMDAWAHDNIHMWGRYDGPGIEARALFYLGSILKAEVAVQSASGRGPYWDIGKINGNRITIVNRLRATPPPASG